MADDRQGSVGSSVPGSIVESSLYSSRGNSSGFPSLYPEPCSYDCPPPLDEDDDVISDSGAPALEVMNITICVTRFTRRKRMRVCDRWTAGRLKTEIEEFQALEPNMFDFVLKGKLLTDNDTILRDMGVCNGTVIALQESKRFRQEDIMSLHGLRGSFQQFFSECVAPSTENCAVLRSCLAGGVNPNMADASGTTPLHMAAQGGHIEVIRMLLSHGAQQVRVRGVLPHEVAARHHKFAAAAYLASEQGQPQPAQQKKQVVFPL